MTYPRNSLRAPAPLELLLCKTKPYLPSAIRTTRWAAEVENHEGHEEHEETCRTGTTPAELGSVMSECFQLPSCPSAPGRS